MRRIIYGTTFTVLLQFPTKILILMKKKWMEQKKIIRQKKMRGFVEK